MVSLDKNELEYQYLLGSLLLKTGRYVESIAHLRTVAENRPCYEGAYYSLGQALIRSGQAIEGGKYLARVDIIQSINYRLEQLKLSVELYPDDA
jgi:tetratricopeptide (TPR) repeat protein|tara:strand:- start:6802 stop:7083 length:282 start_codon:yes stop_codon:yes gene_type:complete